MSAAYLVVSVVLSLVGLVAWLYGRRRKLLTPTLGGGLLMVLPYFVHSAVALSLTCGAVLAALWVFRET